MPVGLARPLAFIVFSDALLCSLTGKNSWRSLRKDGSLSAGSNSVEHSDSYTVVRPTSCDPWLYKLDGIEVRFDGGGGAGLGFSSQFSALRSITLSLSTTDMPREDPYWESSYLERGLTRTDSPRDFRVSNRSGCLVFDRAKWLERIDD